MCIYIYIHTYTYTHIHSIRGGAGDVSPARSPGGDACLLLVEHNDNTHYIQGIIQAILVVIILYSAPAKRVPSPTGA